jgi:hypothetical protein
MEIKITEKEETGSTRYFALEFEVQHGGKTHIVNAVLDEAYDKNTDSYQYTVDVVDFESAIGGLSSSDVEEIEKEVESYILAHVNELTGE